MRVIPKKNYFILGTIVLISSIMAITFMIAFKNINGVVSSFKNELKYEELESYAIKNSNFIVYFVNSEFNNSTFDKKFKTFASKNHIIDKIVYIDNDKIDEKIFYNFTTQYLQLNKQIALNNYIFIFSNQNVVAYVPISSELDSMEYIEKVFRETEVIK